MNTQTALIQDNAVRTAQIINLKANAQVLRTLPGAETDHYCFDSEVYQMKSGHEIEVILNPGLKCTSGLLQERITRELGQVLLKAFNKTYENGEQLVADGKIIELAVNADALLVGRKDGIPVSFHSGVMLEPWLYYSKATFVDPAEQQAGLGLVSVFLSVQKSLLENIGPGSNPWIVTRTRNYMVARMVENGAEHYAISTEMNDDKFTKNIFAMTARFLGNDFDTQTGRVKDVYLSGIPQGPVPKSERIKSAIGSLGPRDACYIAGQVNVKRVQYILNKFTTKLPDLQNEYASVA